ncbi:hypothetical protein K7X08_014919 [Anisodus acutangulus]|uniref:Uncharacterized protein n=1 Tax=Anisodus acutangulus TaxID=402998 RepID=A0A9Q1LMH1_9SOLA|nr:hypothetical protein K7X08_014919 [Anisodus acutangulus]
MYGIEWNALNINLEDDVANLNDDPFPQNATNMTLPPEFAGLPLTEEQVRDEILFGLLFIPEVESIIMEEPRFLVTQVLGDDVEYHESDVSDDENDTRQGRHGPASRFESPYGLKSDCNLETVVKHLVAQQNQMMTQHTQMMAQLQQVVMVLSNNVNSGMPTWPNVVMAQGTPKIGQTNSGTGTVLG